MSVLTEGDWPHFLILSSQCHWLKPKNSKDTPECCGWVQNSSWAGLDPRAIKVMSAIHRGSNNPHRHHLLVNHGHTTGKMHLSEGRNSGDSSEQALLRYLGGETVLRVFPSGVSRSCGVSTEPRAAERGAGCAGRDCSPAWHSTTHLGRAHGCPSETLQGQYKLWEMNTVLEPLMRELIDAAG